MMIVMMMMKKKMMMMVMMVINSVMPECLSACQKKAPDLPHYRWL